MPILEWIGKEKVVNHHLEVLYRVLQRKYSYDEKGQHLDDNGSENMIINGDNLSALKSLLPQYEGKIKCIYIDPPYNTGNEGWVYNDNVNDPRIKKWIGDVVGKEGEDLSRDDKWLCMMYPRLKLLQQLLSDDGAIFISIDDNEQANLKLICDEIFGKNNFITNVIWEKNYSPRNDAKYFSASHDFIVIYTKNKEHWNRNFMPRTNKQNKFYKYNDNDGRGYWRPDNVLVKSFSQNGVFGIINPNTGITYFPPQGSCYRFNYEKSLKLLSENKIYFGKNGTGKPQLKRYLSEVNEGVVPQTLWKHDEVSHSQEGKKELNSIIEGNVFDTPKPTALIERILQIATDENSIILDSFAGSGSTAHAVLNVNKADGGNRKFILIEMMDYADTITAERVKRVINGYGEGKKVISGTGGNFSYYELGEFLLNGDDLNENIGIDKIREYVYFTETKCRLDKSKEDEPYLLGIYINTAYYFYYDKNSVTILNREFLNTVKTRSDGYVIYADLCTLSSSELEKHHITFKKIPRDITKL